jgi:hypothetical protein
VRERGASPQGWVVGEGNSAAPDFGDIRCQETVAWVASSAVSRLSKSLASSARKVGLDHHPYLGPLGRRDGAFGNLRCDRGHRGRDVGRIRDRRQIEIHGAPAARCDDPLDAEPHRHRVTTRLSSSAPPHRRRAAPRRFASPCSGTRQPGAGLPDWPLTKWPSGVCSTCFCRKLSRNGRITAQSSMRPRSIRLRVGVHPESAIGSSPTISRAGSTHSGPVRPCRGSRPGSRPAATSASRPR